MRTCARIGCREPVTRKGQIWHADACRKAANRDPLQGSIPKDWPERSAAFWEAIQGSNPLRTAKAA